MTTPRPKLRDPARPADTLGLLMNGATSDPRRLGPAFRRDDPGVTRHYAGTDQKQSPRRAVDTTTDRPLRQQLAEAQ